MQKLRFLATFAFLFLAVSAPAEDFEEAKFNEIVKKVHKIIDAEIAKQFTPSGFKVSPSQIDYS